ncbi:MAG: ABC transporter permease [Bacteroidota bacterium]
MLKHILLLAYRNILHDRTSFFINLIGISTGLASAIFIYLWVQDELQIDRFHTYNDQLYQVMKNAQTPAGDIKTFEWTPGPLAEALKAEFPEVLQSVGVVLEESGVQGIVQVGEARFKAKEQFAGEDFFTMFSYVLKEGNSEEVLKDESSVLISYQLAEKLFPDTETCIGKTLEWEKGEAQSLHTISGVFSPPPSNATDQFDIIFNYNYYLRKNPAVNKWNYGGPSTYILLAAGTDPKKFNQKLKTYLQEKSGEEYQHLFIRRYADKYLYAHYENGIPTGGRIVYVQLFSLIALFILIVACINYTNLATARASRRMKEVGIKKTIGANRGLLVGQYLGESMLISFFALCVAISLVEFSTPWFNQLTGKELSLTLDRPTLTALLSISFITGLLAGSYPAFYLSNFQPISMLRGKLGNILGELWARKGLVVFQFIVSLVLIVAVWLIYSQMNYVQSKNLGFSKDNVIAFKKEGELKSSIQPFLRKLRSLPGVENASSMRGELTHNVTRTFGLQWEGKNEEKRTSFKYLAVDFEFIETMGIKLLAGRSFSEEFSSETQKIIFNESGIKAMGLENPIGEIVRHGGKEKQIVGIVEDFHVESLYKEISPSFLYMSPKMDPQNILVKIKAGREQATLQEISNLYAEFTAGLPFDFVFLDDSYQKLYESEQKVATLSKYFAGFALLISSLGLFGLTAYSAERRKKEIGIRKILGATVSSIIGLISREFLLLVGLAILIATPISWYLMEQWLQSFAYRIPISLGVFLLAGLGTGIFALATVSFQSIRAATANPITSLRTE